MLSRSLYLVLLFLSGPILPAQEIPGYEDELVSRLVERVTPEEIVRMPAQDREFVSLFRRSTGTRAVILLHGMGAHADWPGIVSTLRLRLPERGWSTLSVQLPVLAPQRSLSDYGALPLRARPRIAAAIAWLKQAGYTDIVLAGHSFGATIAVSFLAEGQREVRALVGISMQEFPFLSPPLKLVDQLVRIDLPVFDIYGIRDYSDVLRSVDDRRLAAARAGNDAYRQQAVNDSDHDFSNHLPELVDRIADWLDTVVTERMQQDPFYLL